MSNSFRIALAQMAVTENLDANRRKGIEWVQQAANDGAQIMCFNEKFYYWPGHTPPQVFDLGGVKIGVAICYDRHFPEYTRHLVLQGADIIFTPFAC